MVPQRPTKPAKSMPKSISEGRRDLLSQHETAVDEVYLGPGPAGDEYASVVYNVHHSDGHVEDVTIQSMTVADDNGAPVPFDKAQDERRMQTALDYFRQHLQPRVEQELSDDLALGPQRRNEPF